MEMKEQCAACGREETLYKIGMFAAMNRVTVKTLRFYEQQGLLLPKKVDAGSGYRYYTISSLRPVRR